MTKIKCGTFLGFLVLCFSQTETFANQCDISGFSIYKVGGYTLSNSEINILAQDRFTQYSIGVGKDEVVRKLTVMIESQNSNPRGSRNPKELAEKIYKVSEAYGVDPILYGAKIWQESGLFNVDVVNPKGKDTGLSQMTSAGLNEVYEQYKKINSRAKSERPIGNILYGLSKRYFGSVQATNRWFKWVIETNNTQKKQTLVQSVDYALAIGASLFKIYLAEDLGSYNKAIKRFNGGGTNGYLSQLTNKAATVRNMNLSCAQDAEIDLINRVCEIVGTENACEQVIQQVLSDSKRLYDI